MTRDRIKSVVLLPAVAVLMAFGPPQDPSEYADARAQELVTRSRIAISGGPGGLTRLHGLLLKGRSRIPEAAGGLMDASVEIRIQLPDRYVRVDTGAFGRRVEGYAGNSVLSRIEKPNEAPLPGARTPLALLANKWVLARFMFGTATWAAQEVPLKVDTRGAVSEMPGKGDPMGVAAASDRGFAIRLIFDAQSRLPVRLIYWDADHNVSTMSFSDHRPVNGLKLPFHIVTTTGDRTVDELTFDAITLNPALTKADFTD